MTLRRPRRREVLPAAIGPSTSTAPRLVVTSPGVPEGHRRPAVGRPASACRSGASWSSGPDCARSRSSRSPGTNGKTTTVELIAAAMRAAGLNATACGNVGYPLSAAAREPFDALAVEASSFQLRFASSFHPRVSVLLNLAPGPSGLARVVRCVRGCEGAHLREPDGYGYARRERRRCAGFGRLGHRPVPGGVVPRGQARSRRGRRRRRHDRREAARARPRRPVVRHATVRCAPVPGGRRRRDGRIARVRRRTRGRPRRARVVRTAAAPWGGRRAGRDGHVP